MLFSSLFLILAACAVRFTAAAATPHALARWSSRHTALQPIQERALGQFTYFAVGMGACGQQNTDNNHLTALLLQVAIFQCYGLTEAGMVSMETNGEQRDKPSGSAGVLLPGIVTHVQRADGTFAGFNEPRELIVKTQSMASGYSNNEEATKETFVDGWVRTGDKVTINENMEIFIIDRLKEMLKVRGFQVAPAEMEAHLAEHPFVSEVCVIGIPHEFHGELP